MNENLKYIMETSSLVSPYELLIYYLYKLQLDEKNKRDTKEDKKAIISLAISLGIIKEEENINVFKGSSKL